VNVKDRGIDVDWEVELATDVSTASPLLRPGWNVFQHKQRDVFAQGRQKTISNLIFGVKNAVKEVYENTLRRPSSYILFTNIDLTHEEKDAVRESLLDGYDEPQNIRVEIAGAAEIATLLNSLPYLRTAYFATANFTNWQEAWNNHSRAKLAGALVKLIGRDDDLKALRAWVDDPSVRVVVVAGPHLMGKSRLVMEAAASRQLETVVSLDPISLQVSDLLKLVSPGIEVLVVVEDPDPTKLDALVDQALARSDLKLAITLPTEGAVVPDLGRGDRVRTLSLQPISDQAAEELLKAAGSSFHFGLQSWIIEQAAGNPGVVLWAASVGLELPTRTANFSEEVARAFETKVRRALGDEAIAVLQLLSLLTDVGFDQHVGRELEVLCIGFGYGIQPNKVLNLLPRLQSAGVIRCTGVYAQVIPPPFGNHLAVDNLRGRDSELLALFAALSQPARLRLLRRLRLLKSEEATRFWDALFAPNGMFGSLQSALTHSRLLRLVAGAVPEKVADLIHTGLANMTAEERQQIHDSRRELMWTMEEILFRRRTSTIAVRCLALLAVAETENCVNNSTGVLCECFRPVHPQLPIPLGERLSLLNELAASTQPCATRLLAVKAIRGGLNRMGFVMLRRSSSGEPFDGPPGMTYSEVWDYGERCVEVLFSLAHDEDTTVAKAAQLALPEALTDLAFQGGADKAVGCFERVVTWSISDAALPVSDIAAALQITRHGLSQDMAKADAKTQPVLEKLLKRLDDCLARLEGTTFSARLKRWAGNWGWRDDESIGEEQGRKVYRFERELCALAEIAAADPDQMTDELFGWVCSAEARRSHVFFRELGMADKSIAWRSRFERVGGTKEGVKAFSCYFGGVYYANPQLAEQWLDEMISRGVLCAESIIEVTGYLTPNITYVKRLEQILAGGSVEGRYLAQQLDFWATGLTPGDYLRLLKAIAGNDFRFANDVVGMLGTWDYKKNTIEGELAEFAWACLERAGNVDGNQAYHFDQLAAELAQADSNRGFKLLGYLLQQPYDKHAWRPIERHSQNEFWNFLRDVDRKRALQVVFTVASEAPEMRWLVSWEFKEIVNQEEDADLLVAIALENAIKARCVAETITSGRPGFWQVALKIVETYPNNDRVLRALAGGVEQMGTVISGPCSSHSRKCLEEVSAVLADQSTAQAARPWLEQIKRGLQKQFEIGLTQETDEEVNQYLQLADDTAAPERLWAIQELIRRGNITRLCSMFPKQELLELLPQLGLQPDQVEALRSDIEGRS
jgi:hypothetical protein